MDTKVEDILDRILQSYPQTVFTKNIEFIKKTNANLEDVDTIQSIKTLAILLEVLGNAELALQTSSIIDKIEFTGDMLIWEKVRDVLILEYFIYQERKEFQKAKAIMDKMTLVFERGDEAQQRKSKRILDRVLNGSLLHTEEIENAIENTKDCNMGRNLTMFAGIISKNTNNQITCFNIFMKFGNNAFEYILSNVRVKIIDSLLLLEKKFGILDELYFEEDKMIPDKTDKVNKQINSIIFSDGARY